MSGPFPVCQKKADCSGDKHATHQVPSRPISEKAFNVKPTEPSRPIPAQPAAPVTNGPEQVAYGKLTHEDILRARLEGKIDTATMESMLTHLDGEPAPQIVPKVRDAMLYYG